MEKEEKIIRDTKPLPQKQERERRKGVTQRMAVHWKEMESPVVKHKCDVILFLSTLIQEQNPDVLGTTSQRFMVVRTSPSRWDHCPFHTCRKEVSIPTPNILLISSPTVLRTLTKSSLYFSDSWVLWDFHFSNIIYKKASNFLKDNNCIH